MVSMGERGKASITGIPLQIWGVRTPCQFFPQGSDIRNTFRHSCQGIPGTHWGNLFAEHGSTTQVLIYVGSWITTFSETLDPHNGGRNNHYHKRRKRPFHNWCIQYEDTGNLHVRGRIDLAASIKLMFTSKLTKTIIREGVENVIFITRPTATEVVLFGPWQTIDPFSYFFWSE